MLRATSKIYYGKDYKKMIKKFQRAFVIALSTFIIMPAGSTYAAETDTADKQIVSEYNNNDNTDIASTKDTISDGSGESEDYDFTPVNLNNKYGKKQNYLDSTSDTILVDDTATLNLSNVPSDYTVSFQSKHESLLKVNELSNTSCEYTGKKSGKTYIIITIKEPVFLFMSKTTTLKYKVTVSPRAVSIKFNKNKYTLSEGKSQHLKLTIRPSISKEQPEFDVSNPRVISVNSKGKVFAKNEGTSYVTASISNGKSAKCRVIVK